MTRLRNEIKAACKEKEVDFAETRKWINSTIENLDENLRIYYVSMGPTSTNPNMLIDIVIVVKDRVYDFTFTSKGTEYGIYFIENFKRIVEDTNEKEVSVNFYYGVGEGFHIIDKIENLQKVRKFTNELNKMLLG